MPTRPGAWTSPSPRRRATTGRDGLCSRRSTSRSGNKRSGSTEESSPYGEDEHGRAREASREDGEEVRGQTRGAQRADPQPADLAGGARHRASEAAGAAARFERDPPAHALRDHGPLPWRLPQVRAVAREDPRGREPRRDSGRLEGELVRNAA